jgi:hypothetical protein
MIQKIREIAKLQKGKHTIAIFKTASGELWPLYEDGFMSVSMLCELTETSRVIAVALLSNAGYTKPVEYIDWDTDQWVAYDGYEFRPLYTDKIEKINQPI